MLFKIFFSTAFIILYLTPNSSGAESGGMPQLDPEFWLSQIFWLILTFGFLFIVLSKFILPKISENLENRKSRILENIEIADKQRKDSEDKLREFDKIINESKSEAKNILINAKNKIVKEINKKQQSLENDINSEIKEVENEINIFKEKSPEKINKIAVETASDLLKQLIGTELNKSSISAMVEELSKKGKSKYYGT